MKILIYGTGSYIGNHYRDALMVRGHDVKCVDAIKNKPVDVNFSGVDSVIDVAGIAHVKITPDMEDLFYRVNTNLAIDLCREAKANGVKQFIYMSSMNVFGDTQKRIYSCSQENPKNFMERVNYWQTKVFKLWPHRILKLYRSDHQLYMVKDVRGILHYLLNYLSFFRYFHISVILKVLFL